MASAKKRKTGDVPELAQAGNGNGSGTSFGFDSIGADSRRKKSAASRIGRACDRCQHRKLACDPSPDGCPPCQKVNAWCTVTDPLTGTPTYRGEFEYLEKRVEKQHRDIEGLLARLRAVGQDIDMPEDDTPEDRRYNAWKAVKVAGDTRPWDREERNVQNPKNAGPPPVPTMRNQNGENGSAEQNGAGTAVKVGKDSTGMPEPLAPESYVGLVTARGHPVSSRLNMFGWEIDLASFTTPDADDPKRPPPSHENPVYDRSYRSGMASVYGTQPRLTEPRLPSKEEMITYANILLQVLNIYTPALHKKKYLTMVNHVVGNPQATPTIAQKVILHLTVANIYIHQATRNQGDQKAAINAMADQHYHYCLGHFGDLLAGDTLEDIQALALVCIFTRNFPKPEMCWAVSYQTFARLIELSYHRAPQKKRRDSRELSLFEIEMQKRLFWVVFCCIGVCCGKLGRPMPLRREDYDVDYPASIPDDALSDNGIDEQISQQQECEFQPHIELCKLTPIYMDVCSTIYTARRGTQGYKAFVEETEQRLKSWHAQLPDKYKRSHDDEDVNDLDRMSISFLNFFMYELRLLIHHPSLSNSKGGPPNHDDLRVCLSVSHGMLQFVKQMQRLRSLECTWHTCALFMLAIQTTLYAHGLLRDEITSEKVEECRQDMSAWLSIIGDMGALLGSKDKLQQKVGEQIQGGIRQLQMVVAAKARLANNKPPRAENQGRAEVKLEETAGPPNNHPQTPQAPNAAAYANYGGGMPNVNAAAVNGQQHYGQAQNSFQDMQAYQNLQQQNYSYPNAANAPMPNGYSAAGTMPNGYQATSGAAGYGLQQMAHHPHPSASPVSPYTSAAQQTVYGNNAYYSAYGHHQPDPTTTWLQYTQALNANMTGSPHSSASGHTSADYQPAAASALLQLGHTANRADGGASMLGVGDLSGVSLGGVHNYSVSAAQQWPLGFMADNGVNGFDGPHG